MTFLTKLGGWVLIIDGICAWYLSWAASLNSLVPDKLPLWPYPYSPSGGDGAHLDPGGACLICTIACRKEGFGG